RPLKNPGSVFVMAVFPDDIRLPEGRAPLFQRAADRLERVILPDPGAERLYALNRRGTFDKLGKGPDRC
ncbi:MAG: hypothetical protein EDS66_09720, partial [Planctomycetota bacterium]